MSTLDLRVPPPAFNPTAGALTDGIGETIDLSIAPTAKQITLVEEVPPLRQIVTRRYVVYAVVISCLAVAIVLIVMAGVLFSQNQDTVQTQPSNPPVTWQLQSPQSNIPQGLVLMSPNYFYTVSFGNELQLFATTTLGGSVLWFSGTSVPSTVSSVKTLSREKKIWERTFQPTRTLNFSSTGILSINDATTGQILWQSSTTSYPVDTYFLEVTDVGEFRIVSNAGTIIWSVTGASPSGTSSDFSISGNRVLNPGMTLKNGPYVFTFASDSGRFVVNRSVSGGTYQVVWTSNTSQQGTLQFTGVYTTYGNLIIYDSNRDVTWNSETTDLDRSPTTSANQGFTSRYSLVLQPTGVVQLQYDNSIYFQTTTDGSNRVIRNPSVSWSRCNPYSLQLTPNQAQTVIQSSDQKYRLVYEGNGSLSIYNGSTLVFSTGNQKGDLLVLSGMEQSAVNPLLMGSLSLLPTGATTPSWSFAPMPPISSPSTQLPVTLCFAQGKLTLLGQNQEVLNTLAT
jgi:hypothetical protein